MGACGHGRTITPPTKDNKGERQTRPFSNINGDGFGTLSTLSFLTLYLVVRDLILETLQYFQSSNVPTTS